MLLEKIEELLRKKETRQFIRFCIVGATCFLIDAAVYQVVLKFAPYLVALISGYLISLCFNYFLTVYWTFQTQSSVRNLVGIVGAHVFNLGVVRTGLLLFFVEGLGLSAGIAYWPMAVISAITNYLVIRTVVKYSKGKHNLKINEQKQ